MIYIHPNTLLHTPQHTTDFNFILYLSGKTPILKKPLLVNYYYYKEKKRNKSIKE